MRRINSGRNFRVSRRIDRRFSNTKFREGKRFSSVLERDFAAMASVWKMLRRGAVRAFGEIGRQY